MPSPPTILVVEDDDNSRLLLGYIVAHALPQVHVVEVTNVADALHVLQSVCVAAVITDFQLPDGTGLEVLARIRAAHPDVPVFANSADTQVGAAMLRAGATVFLPKPYDISRFVQQLQLRVPCEIYAQALGD